MVSPRNIRQKITPDFGRDDSVENDADYLEARRLSQLHSSEISIITNEYSDIFSDFDPRPYSVRELSVDFIDEVKRASCQKGDRVELRIMVPKAKRKQQEEEIIRRRISAHFKDGLHHVHSDLDRMSRKSVWYIAFGMALMLVATYISSLGIEGFLNHFLFVFFEPAGWFIFWTGLDIMFVKKAERNEDHGFYRKLASCRISFVPY